jgi:protein-tyrosine-phosphatase
MTPKFDSSRDGEPFRILFVCTGNTCRSPMAEGIARAEIERRGWRHVEVRSAGVAAGEGLPASDGAVRVGQSHGVDLTRHESTFLTPALVEWADLVLAMAPHHLHRVRQLDQGVQSALLTSFADGEHEPGLQRSVLDPIGEDDVVYDATFRELRKLVDAVLERLEPILSP